jgi:hypothetical protein
MQSTGYYPPPSQQQAYNMLQQQQQSLPPQQTSPLPTRQLARPIPQQQLPHQQQQHSLSQVMEDGQDPLDDDEDAEEEKKPMRRSGRRKIKIEYIEDKTRRHITFSKRKAGIMKKVKINKYNGRDMITDKPFFQKGL